MSEEASYENKVEVVEQKTENSDPQHTSTSISVTELFGMTAMISKLMNITLTEPHHPVVKQVRIPITVVMAVGEI
jgi:hypothetical protein